MRRAATLVATFGAALALAACGPPKPHSYTITIANMAFGPAPPELHVGDAIEWVNADLFQHTATAQDGSFDVELKPEAHARTVLAHAGTVAVRCRYHPGMTLTLSVAP